MNGGCKEGLRENQAGESVKFGVRVKTGLSRTRHAAGVNWSVGSYLSVHCGLVSMYIYAGKFFFLK